MGSHGEMKEMDMQRSNDNTQPEVIDLGAVSVETKGAGFDTEVMGLGNIPSSEISED